MTQTHSHITHMHMYMCTWQMRIRRVGSNYRSLLQNIVSFIGLFCERDVWFIDPICVHDKCVSDVWACLYRIRYIYSRCMCASLPCTRTHICHVHIYISICVMRERVCIIYAIYIALYSLCMCASLPCTSIHICHVNIYVTYIFICVSVSVSYTVYI